MQLLSVQQGEDKALKLRLFNSAKPEDDLHLGSFAEFVFEVFEKGHADPLISKTGSDISATSEYVGKPKNIINILFVATDTSRLRPNPSTKDRVRVFKLFGIDSSRRRTLLENGFFYIEDMVALT